MKAVRPALVVPAFNPPPSLVALLERIHSAFDVVVVVNDGSDALAAPVFSEASRWAKVITLPKNSGKGAALKFALSFLAKDLPHTLGVVFADADGQHTPEDILRVADRWVSAPDSVIVGARSLKENIPTRSRIGNMFSTLIAKWILGISLTDTQTGLRAIPARLFDSIRKLPSSRYDFETEMLLFFKHASVPLIEIPIETLYEPGNPTSHFRPLRDSGRIAYLLLRFFLLSLVTAAVDNVVYFLAPGWPLIFARAVAMFVQYPLARKAVFVSDEPHRLLLPRYLVLLVGQTIATSLLLQAGIGKVAAELILFPFTFWLQREYVFRSRRFEATNWTTYYQSVPWTAQLTRRYTSSRILDLLSKNTTPCELIELGGANSCFADPLLGAFPNLRYGVVDNNAFGLELLQKRLKHNKRVQIYNAAIQALPANLNADAVLSVGLIEHFSGAELQEAVAVHFRIARPGGLVLISFPTPTILYSLTRAAAELLGLWKFPDERPLWTKEVVQLTNEYGTLLHSEILWPLVLTQSLIVVRANP